MNTEQSQVAPTFHQGGCGMIAGSVPIGHGTATPTLERNPDSHLWPQSWRQDDCHIALDGYVAWPDRLLLGRSDEDRQKLGSAILEDPARWAREVKNGCFNLIVHDHKQKRSLFLSDRFNFVPLYLLRRKEGWWFASDLEALRRLVPGDLQLDKTGLAELYWFGYQIGNRTAYKDVEMISAGTIISLSWCDGSVNEESWCRPSEDIGADDYVKLEDAPVQFVELVTNACNRLYDSTLNYGITLSGGMDSRMIAACWQHGPMRSYTWGDKGSAEMRIAALLAESLGFHHTEIPVCGDFFGAIHPELFMKYGVMDFVNGLGIPFMLNDDCNVIFNGHMSDVLFAGNHLKRCDTVADNIRYALGMRFSHRPAPASNDAIADAFFRSVRLEDDYLPIIPINVKQELVACRESILHDVVKEIQRVRNEDDSLDTILETLKINNRTRRYIVLMDMLYRPLIQPCSPFVDNDLVDYSRRIRSANKANKKLYIKVYTEQLSHLRSVPPIMSLLPYSVPQKLHYYGRIVRHLREVLAEKVIRASRGRIQPRTMDAFQWPKWLASNAEFREGITEYLEDSTTVDKDALSEFMQSASRYRAWPVGTRLMSTVSYCAWHKPAYSGEAGKDRLTSL